ncbi:osmoprotectant transport system substrate-binding protein [Motilibacter rhizosphaerae]|uniref:Osmoprotectant transport system substrate-binding protein n=1 Tax=Motilibacter rhizosphaerae TaxID=598652 RepID=A0A4Q7NAG7_9ACTN|nr:glycine betaine ABC transporter substrate-binding protein [Motilibacter rhizosphaerae]RZS79438.1 osmoprotectant transport system substrate-binding protein [Motilibacter rhizosphaerae]
MSVRRTTTAGAVLAAALVLAGCGASGSSSGTSAGAAPAGSGGASSAPLASGAASGAAGDASAGTGGAACAPVADSQLVVLTDDKKLQTVDNVVPAINAKAATPALTAALDKVSSTLTTSDLVDLNRQVSAERKTSPNVAKAYVAAKGLASGLSGGKGSITVGAANFAENQTVASIYADVLDAAGFSAKVQTVGNREVYLPALEKGQLQVVPEYLGTLTEFLNKGQNGANAKALATSDTDATLAAVQPLAKKAGLALGKPAEAADQNAFAVTKKFADEHKVKTLSDLTTACGSGLVLGGPAECPTRPFCQPGLESTYGLKFDKFQALDAGGPLTQTALKTGKISIGLVFSSDGGLTPAS